MKCQSTLSGFTSHSGSKDTVGTETLTHSEAKRTKLQARGAVMLNECVNDQQLLDLESVGAKDLGRYSDETICHMSNEDKYKLMRQVFRPSSTNKFPVQCEYQKNRSFQHSWLQSYPWLIYSGAMNGGFCLPCVFFAKGNCRNLGQLINSPTTKLTWAKKTPEEHNVQECHVVATKDLDSFLRQMEWRIISRANVWATRISKSEEKSGNTEIHPEESHSLWKTHRS